MSINPIHEQLLDTNYIDETINISTIASFDNCADRDRDLEMVKVVANTIINNAISKVITSIEIQRHYVCIFCLTEGPENAMVKTCENYKCSGRVCSDCTEQMNEWYTGLSNTVCLVCQESINNSTKKQETSPMTMRMGDRYDNTNNYEDNRYDRYEDDNYEDDRYDNIDNNEDDSSEGDNGDIQEIKAHSSKCMSLYCVGCVSMTSIVLCFFAL